MDLQLAKDVVDTPATTETGQETPNAAMEVKEGVVEGGKIPDTIPYYRFKEVIDERDRARRELDALRPSAEAYQNLVKYYEENPDKAQQVREIYEGKKTIEEIPEEDYTLPEIKQMQQQLQKLQEAQQKYEYDREVEKLASELHRGLTEVETIITQKQLPITRDEIIEVMQKEYIKSPQTALQVLMGRKIDDITKSFQQKYVDDLKKVPLGSPSFAGTKGALAQQRPKNFDEAAEMMLKDLSGK